MEETPFDMEPGETLLRAEEMQVVPDNGAPQPGQVWLTSARIVARWTGPGGLLRPATPREIAIRLREIVEARTPGGPLVQIVAQDGTRLSLQSFHPIRLRQTIAEAVAQAKGLAVEPAGPSPGSEEGAESGQSAASPARQPEMTCSRCEGSFAGDARFCPHCGLYQNRAAAYCRRCDRDYPAHYRYCLRCGETLACIETTLHAPGERTDVRSLGH
jgi:hypothetical protein